MRGSWWTIVGLFAAMATAAPVAAAEGSWPAIRDALFAGRELKDGGGLIAIEAPGRAQDAAVVPVTVRALQPQSAMSWIRTVHLIIDENPAPVAGVFHLFPETGDATIATRIRVNQYTNLHAVAETSDGELYMVERFIKAAGGCSAPGLKDKATVMARLGQMKLKPLTAFAPGQLQQAQLLISHPNYTGMQMDQLTRYWIPPDYVRLVKIRLGETPILEIEGDIALSEDPVLHFLVPGRCSGTHDRSGRGQRGPQVRAVLADRADLVAVGMTEGLIAGADGRLRCAWAGNDPLYQAYHDQEWGRPTNDDRYLFEKLCLEGFQSGLSWLTILRKRDNFRRAFANFDAEALSRFGPDDVTRLLGDAGIVRHRGKIESTVNNAHRALELRAEAGSIHAFVRQFAPPPRKSRVDLATLRTLAKTSESTALSKELRRRGWSFVGPTTVYAFMQAVGLVDDHVAGCWVDCS